MSTETLHRKKKKELVPQLRFSGFEGQWKEKKIGQIFKINAGGDIDNERVSFEKTEKFKYPIYANAKKDKGFYGYSDIYKIEAGTITVAGRGVYIGIAHARDHKYYPIVRLLILKPLANEDIYFSENVLNRLNLFIESTGVPQLTAPQFSNYKISMPSLPEQQKIASFLSAVDEKIQQLSRKKELLEQYKKGVMQQLFSGKLRFKDANGNDYVNWEEKTFGDIFTFYTTNSLSREKLNYENGEVKNIHYGDIHTKFKTLFDIKNELVPFVNSDFDVSKIKGECYCKEGDLVIADASEDYADIGKSIEIVNLQNEKVIAGLHTFLARPNKIKMQIGFSGYIVRSDNFRKQIMIIAQGSKVLSISTGRLATLKMKVPCISEQQKIANFLSSIDIKIEHTNQEINQMQNFKKGLLQQLFV